MDIWSLDDNQIFNFFELFYREILSIEKNRPASNTENVFFAFLNLPSSQSLSRSNKYANNDKIINREREIER